MQYQYSKYKKKINFLQNFVDEFDIIVLTETHLDNSIENRDIELDSFDKNPQRKDRTKVIIFLLENGKFEFSRKQYIFLKHSKREFCAEFYYHF